MLEPQAVGRYAKQSTVKNGKMGGRESDSLIVLRDGKADHMGKGWAVWRKTHRKLLPDMQGRNQKPTSLSR